MFALLQIYLGIELLVLFFMAFFVTRFVAVYYTSSFRASNILLFDASFRAKRASSRTQSRTLAPDGFASNPWNLYTTDQVEELKAIIKVLLLWSTGIMMSVSTSQTSFHVLQAKTMNHHIHPNFQIPLGSFSSLMMLSVFVIVGIYDRIALSLASRIAHKPVRISAKTLIRIGLVLCVLNFITSALIGVQWDRAIGVLLLGVFEDDVEHWVVVVQFSDENGEFDGVCDSECGGWG
ncbi:protein NRT1/ PTR FAMILY 1.2-like [Senna tora]|uniref:Protein NRT1/ PTR FAMILY 1.2-like n=1 Tax=Senna tora TaxID=362788 RepID=A0A834WAG6_9FABA|nr:protein NRT1/ PTR FAMILY 1.2-like [Senna tora]